MLSEGALVGGHLAIPRSSPPHNGRKANGAGADPYSGYQSGRSLDRHPHGIAEGIRDGPVAVEWDHAQIQYGGGAEEHVQGPPDVAPVRAKEPRVLQHLVQRREGHDHQAHQAVGHGQAGDEVVGGRVQVPLPDDGQDDQWVAENRGEGEQEEEGKQAYTVVGQRFQELGEIGFRRGGAATSCCHHRRTQGGAGGGGGGVQHELRARRQPIEVEVDILGDVVAAEERRRGRTGLRLIEPIHPEERQEGRAGSFRSFHFRRRAIVVHHCNSVLCRCSWRESLFQLLFLCLILFLFQFPRQLLLLLLQFAAASQINEAHFHVLQQDSPAGCQAVEKRDRKAGEHNAIRTNLR